MTKEIHEIPTGSPAERIMDVASKLFYTHGYRATGINEIIAKSGVAKATFYSHFKTKDELCAQYLKGLRDVGRHSMDIYVGEARGVVNKFLAPIRAMEAFMVNSNFRGCAFINIASEMPDCGCSLRKEGMAVYDDKAIRIKQLSEALIASNPEKYAGLDPTKLSQNYLLILAGSVALAELYGAVWPMQQGVQTLKDMIAQR
jgi:AcrR family transcriptional regulator